MEKKNEKRTDSQGQVGKIGRKISRNYRKRYKLHELCYARKVKDIKELLQQNNTKAIEMLNEKAGVLGYTPLHEAASSGFADVLELLLTYGGDPNATSGGDYTPLHIAATIGDCECIKVLLEHGADIRQEDEYHKTPYVKAKLSGRVKAARQLLSAEIIAAAAVNDQNLGKKIADLQPGKDIEENCLDRALEKAVICNHQRATGFLCLEGCRNEILCLQKALVQRAGCYEAAIMLLLCHAARLGDIEIIRTMVEGFSDRKRYLEEEGHNVKGTTGGQRPALSSSANQVQLRRGYLPQEWERTLPYHILENLRDEATRIEMAFPICIAVNHKKYDAAKLLLLETCTSNEFRLVDWHGLALNVLRDDWIKRVVDCEKLILSRNTISKLPKSIITLKALSRLDLSENRLTKVPKEIFEMHTLKNLNLAGNKLQSLPAVEEWSQSMTILDLRGNFLQALPDAIQDSFLVDLNIAGNYFLQFPPCICEISTLRVLDISKNRYITVLPPELGKLRKLQSFQLNDMDQITDPPPAMRKPTSTLIRYLEATLRGSEPYYNMKLMFVGLANKGKTTLLRRLQGDFQFNADQSTVGVEIREIVIRKGSTYTFKCWDFAGQEEYYATHQCFLSQRSMYVLVWDFRDREEGVKHLRPWLDNLGTRVPHSTVIIVGTHLDQIPDHEIKEGFIQKMTSLLWSLVRSRGIYQKVHVPNSGYVAVGKDMPDTIEHLRNVIYTTAENMTVDGSAKGTKIMGDRVPSCYLQLARAIGDKLNELYNERKIPILKKEEYANLLLENSRKTSRDVFPDDLELATTFLHNIGVILHYDDPNQNLRDLYFIDPSWLCQLMGQVVTVKEVHNFFVHGILDISKLSQIIRSSNSKFPVEFYPQYLRLLYRFQIACKVDDARILVPSVLPVVPPDNFEDAIRRRPMLDRVYSLVCIPPGFWARFIGRLLLYMTDVLGPVRPTVNNTSEFPGSSPPQPSPHDKSEGAEIGETVKDDADFSLINRDISDTTTISTRNTEDEVSFLGGKEFQKQLSIVFNDCVVPVGPENDETASSTDGTPLSEYYRPLHDSVACSINLASSDESRNSSSFRHLENGELTSDRLKQDACSHVLDKPETVMEKDYGIVDDSSSLDGMTPSSAIVINDHRKWEPLPLLPPYSTGMDNDSKGFPTTVESYDIPKCDNLCAKEVDLSASVKSEDLPRFYYRKESHPKETEVEFANLKNRVVDSNYESAKVCDSCHEVQPEDSDEDDNSEVPVIEMPERPNETFNGTSLRETSFPDYGIAVDEGQSLTFDGDRDICTLLDKGILKCWRTGMLFEHPSLVFSISQTENDGEREVFRIKVSRTRLGFSVLGRIVDHFRTLIKEWYPGYTGDDGQQPFIIGLIPCPLCMDFNFHQVHYFDIRDCLSNFFANDYVLCPNNHIPRVIKLSDICPDLAFRDLDKSYLLHSSALQFNESEDSVIGVGNFGTVYRGKCRTVPAAIKVYNFHLDKDDLSLALDKFYEVRQEVIVLSRLKKHPLIIGFLGVCIAPKLCATMELAGRGTLKDPLHKKATHIPRSVVYRIAHQLISALAYLHTLGLIHRDLKSDNVLLFSLDPEADINIKLADFGTTDFINSTGLKFMVGTVGFHAPEMLEYSKTDEYTSKVDVYSFAIVLSELITKRRPFADADSELTIAAMVKDGKRPKFSDVSTAYFGLLTLTELMVKSWDGDAMKRPSSAIVQKQLSHPAFYLLMGKYELDYVDSPRSMLALPSVSEIWIGCYSCNGPYIVVIDMETGRLKSKFVPNHGKSKSRNMNIVHMYDLGDGFIGVVMRNVQDFLFVLKLDKKEAVDVHGFDDSFILAITFSADFIFLGFHSGRIIRLNRKELLKGKIRDLTTIATPRHNHPVRCLTASEDRIFVGRGDNVYVYGIKSLQSGGQDALFTFYQEGRDSVYQITASEELGLAFFIYNRSSKVTCLKLSDACIIGELDCAPIVRKELSSSNDNDERVTCMCLTRGSLWVGTGSGHVLLFECRFEALPLYLTSLRPYLLETRLMVSYRKPTAGNLVNEVVISSGKEANPLSYSHSDDPLLLLNTYFPIDTSEVRRVVKRRSPSGPNSPTGFSYGRTQDTSAPNSPTPPPSSKMGKLILFWEAMPPRVLKKFPGVMQNCVNPVLDH